MPTNSNTTEQSKINELGLLNAEDFVRSGAPIRRIYRKFRVKKERIADTLPTVTPNGQSWKGSSKLMERIKQLRNVMIMKSLDVISVYDVGSALLRELKVSGKGEAQTLMTLYIYEMLKKLGISTHVLGVVDPQTGKVISDLGDLDLLSSPPDTLLVREFNRPELPILKGSDGNEMIDPDSGKYIYDYSNYRAEIATGKPTILPLEVICREYIIIGVSSVTKSPAKWKKFRDQYLKEHLGADLPETLPDSGVIKLPESTIGVTTKYESGGDRDISTEEASEMIGFDAEEVRDFALKATRSIISYFKDLGVTMPDLKVEIGVEIMPDESRKLYILDVVGVDESRLYFGIDENTDTSHDFSKQAFRTVFSDSNWFKVLNAMKDAYPANWKKLMEIEKYLAPNVNPELIEAQSRVNKALVNLASRKYNSKDIYEEIGSLREEINAYLELKEKLKSEKTLITNDISFKETNFILDELKPLIQMNKEKPE